MAEILNIRGPSETARLEQSSSRERQRAEAAQVLAGIGSDEAVFSREAEQAAEAARLRALAEGPESELRAEELEQVRNRLRDGTYRVQEAVLQVAARVLPVIEQQV